MSEAVVALIAAIFGGAGLKAVEQVLSRNKIKIDAAADFREELRQEIAVLRQELRRVEDELDEWKEKYYKLLAHFHNARMAAGQPLDDYPEGLTSGKDVLDS